MNKTPPTIAYLFTTFPKPTETFLQREVIAMIERGAQLRLYSLWGGGGSFRGVRVRTFPKWKLLTLIWMIPYTAVRWPKLMWELIVGLWTRMPPSWMNFWENMLGAGFACLYRHELKHPRPTWVHAAWGGAPATAAWLLWRLDGHRYSAAAHAYDIYEHGGDWWLKEKLVDAAFIHTSTDMGRRTLIGRGLQSAKVHCIRRGLDVLPEQKTLRPSREPLRIVCVARLVAKKGLRYQLKIYAALKAAGVPFEACIIGDGPMRGALERLSAELELTGHLTFTGHLPNYRIWEHLAWADVLVHTGIVAPSGDRDGLPNVIPEAMAAGTLVVTSPIAATTEAIKDGASGLVAPVESPAVWVMALRRLMTDDALCERLRSGARQWVEQNFNAHTNAARLYALYERAIADTSPKP
ncbi:MAG TPA: glycosyltransferase family 4 protein [Opitutaceae bacterium]|nr:glycosyltransferase family 4 protein [Opitutaceae bacterium]HOR23795.1 glycosyltransferase family 4 protein [Opitutaceae bacterium]HPK48073.1 glycosyltransferase family 4 protein [Opitutaceae bacterium]